jgi:tRNA wybutosine-synthesizing protein 2
MRVRRISPVDLPRITGEGWVDPGRRPVVMDGVAYVPVREGEAHDLDLPERRLYHGRGYQRVGDLVLLHGDRPAKEEVEEINGWLHPRGILWVRGIAGTERTPRVELLSGSAGEVCHREHGCSFVLDPLRVMYAMGNLSERHRLAGLASKRREPERERVGDLFAGIGYFTIPLAREGCRVHAMEISPVAFGYLARNVRLNDVSDHVQAECGDCRDLLRGTYDRLILGHFDAPLYLADALAHARSGTVLHVHTLSDKAEHIRSLARDAGFTAAVTTRRVKSYAPHIWHKVQDVRLS